MLRLRFLSSMLNLLFTTSFKVLEVSLDMIAFSVNLAGESVLNIRNLVLESKVTSFAAKALSC